MIEIGDKVRTHKSWNSRREPIEGIVLDRIVMKYTKTKECINPDGFITYQFLLGKCEYTELIVLDDGTQIHESNLEKVE